MTTERIKRQKKGYALKREQNKVPFIYSRQYKELHALLIDAGSKATDIDRARREHDALIRRIS